jgi:hypothetical protein
MPLRFLAADPVSAAAREQWRATAHYVEDLLTSPLAATSPLITGSAGRLLSGGRAAPGRPRPGWRSRPRPAPRCRRPSGP